MSRTDKQAQATDNHANLTKDQELTFEQAYRTVGQSEYGISPVHSTHLEK